MSSIRKMAAVASVAGAFFYTVAAHAFSWAPINPDELKMTAEPKAPGAAAIILEKQVDRDDAWSRVTVYVRIKILTEDGRKQADIEIPYNKNSETIRSIQARTIRPDGKISEFDGTIYDKVIVKARGVKYEAKTFALPDVQVGSIMEYRFLHELPSYYVYDSQWFLSEAMFVKHAMYSLVPNDGYELRWSWPRGLPPGTKNPVEKNGHIRLETFDVPAFISEDYMPPQNDLGYRVDFIYLTRARATKEKIPANYWQEIAKLLCGDADRFMDERRAMERAVMQIVQPGDSNDEKLRKIYTHVQHLRNLSYEKVKSEQEKERDKIRDRSTVADVEKYGYGNATELTYLYVALARAAGFAADMAFVATRNNYFFEPSVMNPNQLTSNVAVVTVDGKEIFAEPGVPLVPFGLLPWYESGVSGLRLHNKGGSWVKVPLTKASQSVTSRKASFKVDDGSLVGAVTVTYTGLDAIYHRLEERYDDDAARKEYMESELKRAIPISSDVKVTNSPDWNGVETPLIIEYEVKVTGWASAAAKRLLMPIGVFSFGEKHTFEPEKRIHPIYFHYANIVDDEIAVEIPSGWHVVSSPRGRDENIAWMTYSSSVEPKGNAIKIKRNLAVNGVYMPEKYYLALREFYQNIRANDEEQMVLSPVADMNGAKDKK